MNIPFFHLNVHKPAVQSQNPSLNPFQQQQQLSSNQNLQGYGLNQGAQYGAGFNGNNGLPGTYNNGYGLNGQQNAYGYGMQGMQGMQGMYPDQMSQYSSYGQYGPNGQMVSGTGYPSQSSNTWGSWMGSSPLSGFMPGLGSRSLDKDEVQVRNRGLLDNMNWPAVRFPVSNATTLSVGFLPFLPLFPNLQDYTGIPFMVPNFGLGVDVKPRPKPAQQPNLQVDNNLATNQMNANVPFPAQQVRELKATREALPPSPPVTPIGNPGGRGRGRGRTFAEKQVKTSDLAETQIEKTPTAGEEAKEN